MDKSTISEQIGKLPKCCIKNEMCVVPSRSTLRRKLIVKRCHQPLTRLHACKKLRMWRRVHAAAHERVIVPVCAAFLVLAHTLRSGSASQRSHGLTGGPVGRVPSASVVRYAVLFTHHRQLIRICLPSILPTHDDSLLGTAFVTRSVVPR